MIPVLIEASLRAMLVAVTVWAGLRLFRVSNVPAQKAAWGLVLACAVAMPLVMQWRVLPNSFTVRLPAWLASGAQQAAEKRTDSLEPGKMLPSAAKSEVDSASMTRLKSCPFNASSSSAACETVTLRAHRGVLPDAPQAKLSGAAESAGSRGDRFPAPSISASQFASVSATQPAEAQVPTNPAARKSAGLDAVRRILRPGLVAGILYLAVCAVLLIRLAFGLGMAVKLWLAAEVFVLRPELNPQTGLEMEPGSRVRMRFSRAVSSPVTIGSGVLLPADCVEWDAEKLRIVLAHERAHVRQGDFYLQLLSGIYAAVFWFSPLGWWLKGELSDLGEAISDRAGLEEARSRTSYAEVLLEFAALPRPTVLGVAMARSRNLSHRIERFLNETRFRQAFAGSRRRMLLAILLVPVALFAGTALIRVEAAATAQSVQPPAAPPAPNQAVEGRLPDPAIPPAPVGIAVPAAPGSPGVAVGSDGMPPTPPAPGVSPVPPVAPMYGEIHDAADDRAVALYNEQDDTTTNTNTNTNGRHVSTSTGKGYSYSYSSDGVSWALVTDPSQNVTFSGDWHDSTRDSIKKVRQLTNGKFLWFTRDGKEYFLDDAAIVSQIQDMYKPMEALGRQQEVLGKQQEELGRQQEQLGRRQEQASIPTPDISKEIAKLNEAVAKLDAKKGSTVSQEELSDIQGRLGDIQGRLGELQGEVGARQGELGAQQGKLGAEQGRLGAEQGRLGAEQGKIGAEADRKVRSIINESLRNGKARPVE
ncbi:MAG: M56 family metallopeptidase [Terracidiphilus sp.]|jgi:beta-lactamase regulating signal transducer with metallopeptidase domain